MWALRRAVNPSQRINVCMRGLSQRTDFLLDHSFNCSFHGDYHLNHKCSENCRCSNNPSKLPSGFLQSFSPLMGSRTLSSLAGEKTGNAEEVEDGFSELENEKDPIKESLDDSVSDLDVSEVDSDIELEDSVADIEKSGDKSSVKSVRSPLLNIIMEASRTSLKSSLDRWISEGNSIEPEDVFATSLYLRRRRFYSKALQFYEWVEAKKLVDFGARDYASRLDLVAKVNSLASAERYLEKVPNSFRTEYLYRTLLANCVSSLKVNKAEEVFNKMRDLGFPLTSFACNQLLLLYKRLDRKKIADVLLMMEKENVKPTLFTYRLLIDTKGDTKDIEGMEKIVETMKNEGFEDDLIIKATIARHYLFAGQKEKASQVLKDMEGENIAENRAACEPLLSLFASMGNIDEAERIWKVCEESPRFDECLAAIKAFGKLGRIEKAEEVFETMHGKFEKLSSKYYNALLNVYACQNLLTKGKELAKRMADSGCAIGPLTWDALVNLYVQAGEVEKADSMLQKAVNQKKLKPLYSSYMNIMEVYAKRGDVHNAEKIFHRLRENGYVGRMRQYQVLLQAYVKAKTPAYGFRERMMADRIFPNKPVAAQLASVDAFRKSSISELLE